MKTEEKGPSEQVKQVKQQVSWRISPDVLVEIEAQAKVSDPPSTVPALVDHILRQWVKNLTDEKGD